jgi:hypothetical protein
MKKARFLSAVLDDLAEASKKYDEAGGRDLGDRFVQQFYSAVKRVSLTADAHRKIYGDFKRVIVEPFPYKLFFRVRGDDVVFVLLIHAARSPKLIERLLRSRP